MGEGFRFKADCCQTSGLAELLLFKSQALSIFILFLLLSMNPAKVLLNFPLLSMKKHLPFAGILIVRTKALLAARVTANGVEPPDWDQPPTETVEILICLLSPSLNMWEKRKIHGVVLDALVVFPFLGVGWGCVIWWQGKRAEPEMGLPSWV